MIALLIKELRRVLRAHPDVEALALAIDDPDVAREAFALPPMLLASWMILVDHSLEHPELIRRGSITAQLATRLWGGGPWLVWLQPEEKARVRSTRGNPDQDAEKLRQLAPSTLLVQSDFEQALLDELNPRPLHPLLQRLASKRPTLESMSTPSTPEQLARKLRLPPAAVDGLMEDLLQRSRDSARTDPSRKR